MDTDYVNITINITKSNTHYFPEDVYIEKLNDFITEFNTFYTKWLYKYSTSRKVTISDAFCGEYATWSTHNNGHTRVGCFIVSFISNRYPGEVNIPLEEFIEITRTNSTNITDTARKHIQDNDTINVTVSFNPSIFIQKC